VPSRSPRGLSEGDLGLVVLDLREQSICNCFSGRWERTSSSMGLHYTAVEYTGNRNEWPTTSRVLAELGESSTPTAFLCEKGIALRNVIRL
jgi:hypothetical protein